MAMRDLAFRAPPSLALAEGASAPNPGVTGAVAWSTTLVKPMFWNGFLWTTGEQITVSTTAPASPVLNQLWLDIT